MFRVKENSDGSVSVFSNDEKQEFICNIASRSRAKVCPKVSETPSRNLRSKRKNVPLSPTRLQLSPTSSKRRPPFQKKHKSSWLSSRGVCKFTDDEYETSSVTSYESISSKFSHTSIESSTEPDEDSVNQVSYCRMLDLIQCRRLLGSAGYQQVLQSFPVRKISCLNHLQSSRKRSGKRTEFIGFSSLLGMKILKDDPSSKLSESVETLVSKYDSSCKMTVINLPQPSESGSTPLLRTRDGKGKYQVTFKKTVKYVHKYTFNKMQRRHQAECLRIGLNHRSYLLKLKCRPCSVPLKRLSPATISRFCNPPARRLTRAHSLLQQSQTKATCRSVYHGKLPNGLSRLKPVVCLGPASLIQSLLRKFGLA